MKKRTVWLWMLVMLIFLLSSCGDAGGGAGSSEAPHASDTETVTEPVSETEPETESVPETDAEAESEPETESAPETDTEAGSEPEAESETETDTETEPEPEVTGGISFQTLTAGEDNTVYGTVSHATERFSFTDEIRVWGSAAFAVSLDADGTQPVDPDAVALVPGDNTVYVLEQIGDVTRTYTVTLRRRPTYTVTFDTGGGSAVDGQTVEEGLTATVPKVPLRVGYTFLGWDFDFDTPITENTSVCARWDTTKYRVTVDRFTSGGMIMGTQTGAYVYGTEVRVDVALEYLGYTWLGWYDGYGQLITADKTCTLVLDMAETEVYLIAKWAVDEALADFRFTSWSDWCRISGVLDPTKTAYTIPAYVTEIGEKAFFECKSLERITIPERVSEIGVRAFYGCERLAEVTLCETGALKTIGIAAFSGCTALSDISFPEGLTDIGWYAFEGCVSLRSIYVPARVERIGGAAFSRCASIADFTVSEQNPAYHSAGNCLIQTQDGILIAGCSSSVIPTDGSVTCMESYAFAGCPGLESVTLPVGLKTIGTGAFAGCPDLESVTLPVGLEIIWMGAFMDCPRLASIVIPAEVTYIGDHAFQNCASLRTVSFPETCKLQGIYFGLFSGCRALRELEIPSGVEWIDNDAFSGCHSLTSIKIPASVSQIGDEILADCPALSEITVDPENPVYHSAGNCLIDTRIKKLIAGCQSSVIPEDGSVISIGYAAFYNCTTLTDITIPESVTSIGGIAFAGCTGIAEIEIPEGVLNIGYGAFERCDALKKEKENGISYVGRWAVEFDGSTESVTLRGDTYGIGGSLFYDCTRIKSVTIPASVEIIGEYAFRGCAGIKTVTFAEGSQLRRIGASAFQACSNLVSIELPKGVTYIAGSAFRDCKGLCSITLPEGLEGIGRYAFEGCIRLSGVTLPATLTNISEGAFVRCESLSSITIPASVTWISEFAFESCTSLVNVTIGNGVTSIENSAFSGCPSLSSITVDKENPVYHSENNCLIETERKTLILGCKNSVIPKDGSVTSIGNLAFSNCTSLSSITIPDSVTNIGEHAFWGCTNLANVTIGNGVTSIGERAFYDCSSLSGVTFETTEGWKAGSVSIPAADLADPDTAARYLTDTYRLSPWTRS